MQVADAQQAATGATLGAHNTQSVGMVQDASFLMMLSSNLYSNQQLACIREPLCNAWDSHIESGRTDIPLRVTITDDHELIIQDSGYGIPDSKIVQIYGTYGASTKRVDNKQTGGFGLGSKSPWAYTESFRVISENQGRKVIYNMTRASVEADGMPAITKVMDLPTDRTGLTVSFQLRSEDVEQMCEYIRAIALHGDMNVLFSRPGVDGPIKLGQIGMSAEPGSYDVGHEWYFPYMGNHTLFVRYGAVVYPMLQTPGTQKAVNLLKEFMELVGFKRMVVQASPGSLALTPSREALSSQKMTENGITDLCVALVARIEEDLIKQIPGSIMAAVELLASGHFYHGLSQYPKVSEAINPLSVRRYLGCQLGAAKYAKYEMLLKQAEHRGFKLKNTFANKTATKRYHQLRRRIEHKGWNEKADMKMAFVRHFILRPLSRVLLKHRDLLVESKLYHTEHFNYCSRSVSRPRLLDRIDGEQFGSLKKMIDEPTVFITTRLKNVVESADDCPDVKTAHSTWVYHIGPKDPKREDIIKAFEESGIKVVDLTLNHGWDSVATEIEMAKLRRYKSKPKTATLPGIDGKKTPNLLMSLSNVYNDEGRRKMGHDAIKLMKADLNTSGKPLFYVPIECVGSMGVLGQFGSYQDLSDEERKLGVIVRTGVEKNMAIKRGAVHVDRYLAKRLWDSAHSKEYALYRTKQRKNGLWEEHYVEEDSLQFIEHLGIKLTGLDKLMINPAMERIADLIENHSAASFAANIDGLTILEQDHFTTVIKKYRLEKLPLVAKIRVLKDDAMLHRLFLGSDLLDLVKQHPERKAALKSLVVSAFK